MYIKNSNRGEKKMKTITKRGIALIMLCTLILSITACTKSKEAANGGIKKTIKIGCIAFNHDEVAAQPAIDKLKELGYEVEVVDLENATVMNEAIAEGSLDTALHQHKPWMDNYNEQKGTNLIMLEPYIHHNEYSIMSEKYDSVKDLPDGATISVSDDGSNQARAMLFLQELGLITLQDGVTVPTILDIKENPHNYKIVAVQHHQVVKTMADVDACMTSTYLLLSNNVSMDTVMASSDDYKDYGVGFVIDPKNKDEEWVSALIDAYTTDEMRDKINDLFKGGFVPGF